MRSVLFTKLFLGRPLSEVVRTVTRLGVDGVDLLIRPGFHVEPSHPTGIREAVQLMDGEGVRVLMATTDLTDPTDPNAKPVLSACADAGIGLVRLGYWNYDPVRGYAAGLDEARRQLDGLADLARRTGVRLAVQLHGGTLHGSGAQTAALLQGHDPSLIGAYPDPGNQVVQDGREDWRFTFDILEPWLCCVGVKNGGWFPGELTGDGQRRWRSDWLGIAEGMVPWDEITRHLVAADFDGLLSFHSHYEVPFEQVLDQTRSDVGYVARLIEAVRVVEAGAAR